MLLLGFKADWAADLSATRQYVSVWQKAYNLNLSVLVLRTARGLDYSNHILEEELVEAEDRDPVVLEPFSDPVRPEISRKISVEPSGEAGWAVDMTGDHNVIIIIIIRREEEEGG